VQVFSASRIQKRFSEQTWVLSVLSLNQFSEEETRGVERLTMLNPNILGGAFRKLKVLTILGCLSLAASFAYGEGTTEITNAYAYADYGTPGIYCSSHFDDASDVLYIRMTQGGAGQIDGHIYTTSADDPTLTLAHDITNSMATAWNSYHIAVSMNGNPFSIGATPVINTPAGWTFLVTQPSIGNGWQGLVDLYSGGNDVAALGGILNFSYSITFEGSTAFSFTEDAAPGLVPEPSTLALGVLGLVAFGIKRSRRTA
jgi:hypothetical protein